MVAAGRVAAVVAALVAAGALVGVAVVPPQAARKPAMAEAEKPSAAARAMNARRVRRPAVSCRMSSRGCDWGCDSGPICILPLSGTRRTSTWARPSDIDRAHRRGVPTATLGWLCLEGRQHRRNGSRTPRVGSFRPVAWVCYAPMRDARSDGIRQASAPTSVNSTMTAP